jgi:hypothetical protein
MGFQDKVFKELQGVTQILFVFLYRSFRFPIGSISISQPKGVRLVAWILRAE